jgi:adenine-specific DNA methylase
MYDNIDKKYGVPVKEIACPGCGRKYGHHKTTVDIISQECSSCVKEAGYKKVDLIPAKKFIEEILGYIPFSF